MYSFSQRKRQLEVADVVQRIINQTTPGWAPTPDESRSERRSNRVIPILLARWDADKGRPIEPMYALTKDLSGSGLALIVNRPFPAGAVLVGIRHEGEARFVSGTVCHTVPLGGGFWHIGVELAEILFPADYRALSLLEPLIDELEPAAASV